jgi:hypothetical protein
MQLSYSYSRWIAALAALTALACFTPAASANATRAVHRLTISAARNATASHAVRPAKVHHRRTHERHLRATTLTVRRAVGSTRPAHLPVPPKSHRAAALPTIAHRAPTSRTTRGNPQNAWILPGQASAVCLAVRDLRASECLIPMIAKDPVWSGRGPPRAGPHSDHTRPPRPASAGSDADPHSSASASNTNPRLTQVSNQAALRCLLACRPEGTAASSFMPSSGVEHVS